MKNFVNFRPLFFCFVAFLSAILFGWQIMTNAIWYLLFFSLIALLLCVWAFFKKKFAQAGFILLAFALGFLTFYSQIQPFKNATQFSGEQVVVGRVANVTPHNYYQTILLENVVVDLQTQSNILLTVTNGSLELGDKITFVASLENVAMFELGSFNTFAYQNDYLYNAKILQDDISSITKTSPTLQETIRETVYDLFKSLMSKQNADLAYSSLFGDRTLLDAELAEAFNTSGIAHILSVSGMHVAFLILVVDLFLKKIKLSSKFRLLLFAFILAFYSYLCDFNVTVVRASIMALVFISASAFGKQYDGLNSIALAGFLILLWSPLSAYGIGFQLSFLCVFIITLFTKPFSSWLSHHHVPKLVASPLALTICVQAGILPMIAKYFGQISILSVVTNLIAVPIFELAFILTFALLLPVLIMPFLGFLLTFTSFLYQAVIKIAYVIASIDWATIQLFEVSNYTLGLFYVALFILSGFVMMGFRHKMLIFICLLVLSISLSFLDSLPATYKQFTIMQIGQTEQTIIITPEGTSLLIGEFDYTQKTIEFLKKAKICKLDYIINFSRITSEYTSFEKKYNVKQTFEAYQDITVCNIQAQAHNVGGKSVMTITTNGHTLLFLNQQLNEGQKEQANDLFGQMTINGIIGGEKADFEYNADFLIDAHNLVTNAITYNNLNNWYLEIKNGILYKVRSLD